MPIAILRAFAAPFAPPLRRVIALSLVIAAASFALLAITLAALLFAARPFAFWAFDWLLALFGGFAVLVLAWLLFPAVVTLAMSFFVDRIAEVVEAQDFPNLSPPRRRPFGETAAANAKLAGIGVLINLLVLPFYLLLPGLNLLLFVAVNGYLLGRGYFEAVALRRLDAVRTRAVRHRFAVRVYLGGLVIAGLFALPFVNLIAPVIGTALMVNIFEQLCGEDPVLLNCGRSAVSALPSTTSIGC